MQNHYLYDSGRVGVIFLIACMITGCSSLKNVDTLARLPQGEITTKDFIETVKRLPAEIQPKSNEDKIRLLSQMIDERLLEAEAKRRRMDQRPEMLEGLNNISRRLLVNELIQEEVSRQVKIDDEEVRRYFEEHKSELLSPRLFRVSHILVSSEEEAYTIESQLVKGAVFEELARTYSIDRTAMNGGDLGFIHKGQAIPEFEGRVFPLKKGERSKVFQTPAGYHLAKMVDIVEPRAISFAEAENGIRKKLWLERQSGQLKAFLDKIKRGKTVKINAELLKNV